MARSWFLLQHTINVAAAEIGADMLGVESDGLVQIGDGAPLGVFGRLGTKSVLPEGFGSWSSSRRKPRLK